jgi:aryl-alcohol dehydrogenase-like predicted oxidoreductase
VVGVIEAMPFGRTGHRSTRVIFGAAGLGRMTQEEADPVLDVLLDHGVNHIDTAIGYGDAELRLAPWLRQHRDRFFLATKTPDRTGPEARASLERSLERLGVDQVDLIQCHNLVEEDEWEAAHAPGGALDALSRARGEGLVRFIGVTGHGLRIPRMHLRTLERFDCDSVLFPYNYTLLSNDDYRRDVDALIALCAERGVALQTIKSVAMRRWDDGEGPRRSWYKPVDEEAALRRAVQFVLAQPQLFLISSSDTRVLAPILQAAAAASVDGVPAEADLEADVAGLGMRPLFDGAELERI